MLGAIPNAPGFSYDGRHSSEFSLVMLRSPISAMPTVEPKLIQVPGRTGAYLGPVQIRERTIQVEVAIWAGTEQERMEAAHAIAAWLNPGGGERELYFDTDPGKTYRAICSNGFSIEQAVIGTTTIEFTAADPFSYGSEQQVGFVSDAATVTNLGTFEALPVFEATFTAVATEWKVTLGTKYVRVIHDFQAGDSLEVDCATGAVLINGGRSLDKLDWQNSEFFGLPPGKSVLTITPTGVCAATVRFSPRWL